MKMAHELPEAEVVEALGELAPLFQNKASIICKVAYKYGLMDSLKSLVTAAYINLDGIQDMKIVEAITAAAQYHCSNNYCVVWHSFSLLGMGFSFDDIKDMIENVRLPADTPDAEKWNQIIRATYFRFQGNYEPDQSFNMVRKLLTEKEYNHYGRISMMAYFLKFMQEAFHNEIQVEYESLYKDEKNQILSPVAQLAKYYKETKEIRDGIEVAGKAPVVTLCIKCKDVKTKENKWIPVEVAVGSFETNTLFSHGVCKDCKETMIKEAAA